MDWLEDTECSHLKWEGGHFGKATVIPFLLAF